MPLKSKILKRINKTKTTNILNLSNINLSKVNIDELLNAVNEKLIGHSYHELNLSNCNLGALVNILNSKVIGETIFIKLISGLNVNNQIIRLNLDDNGFDLFGIIAVHMTESRQLLNIRQISILQDGQPCLFKPIIEPISTFQQGVDYLKSFHPFYSPHSIRGDFKKELFNIERSSCLIFSQLMKNPLFASYSYQVNNYKKSFILSPRNKQALFELLSKHPILEQKYFYQNDALVLDVATQEAWNDFQQLVAVSDGQNKEDKLNLFILPKSELAKTKVEPCKLDNDNPKLDGIVKPLQSHIQSADKIHQLLDETNMPESIAILDTIKKAIVANEQLSVDITIFLKQINLLPPEFDGKTLLALLNFEPAILDNILPSEDDKNASLNMCRAFWGKMCFNYNNNHAGIGAFYYGLWLHNKELKQEEFNYWICLPDVLEAHKKIGLYWLRIASSSFQCKAAQDAISNKENASWFDSLYPMEKYHLALALEEYNTSQVNQSNTEMLFNKYRKKSNLLSYSNSDAVNCEQSTFSAIAFLFKDEHISPELWDSERLFHNISPYFKRGIEFEFIRNYFILLSDPCLSVSQKNSYNQTIISLDKNYVRKYTYYSHVRCTDVNDVAKTIERWSYELNRYKMLPLGVEIADSIMFFMHYKINPNNRYHKPPLGLEMSDILTFGIGPLLYKPSYETSYKKRFNNLINKTVDECSEEERRLKFEIEIFTIFDAYLDKRELLGEQIDDDTSPTLVAAILCETISNTLAIYELQENPSFNSILLSMQSMRQQLQVAALKKEQQRFKDLGFQHGFMRRLASINAAGKLLRIADLSIRNKLVEIDAKLKPKSPSNEHKSGSNTKKIANGAALAAEGLHIILPPTLLLLNYIKGMNPYLNSLYLGIHAVEHIIEHNEVAKYAIELFPKSLHALHFYHEAKGGHGIHGETHEQHHEPKSQKEFILHIADLIHSAAPGDVDVLEALLEHYQALYHDTLASLTPQSSYIVGDVLLSLLFRGLEHRFNIEPTKSIPASLPELIDYFDDTLWRYSYLSSQDHVLLLTKDGRRCSVLDIIFPNKFAISLAEENIEIEIIRQSIPPTPQGFINHNLVSRHASYYESQIINQSRLPNSKPQIFSLTEASRNVLIAYRGINIVSAIKEIKCLRGKIGLLYKIEDFRTLEGRCQDLFNYFVCIEEAIIKPQNKETIIQLKEQARLLKVCLTNTTHLIKNSPNSAANPLLQWNGFNFMEHNAHSKLTNYLDSVSALTLIITRNEGLKDDLVLNYVVNLDDSILNQMADSSLIKLTALKVSPNKLIVKSKHNGVKTISKKILDGNSNGFFPAPVEHAAHFIKSPVPACGNCLFDSILKSLSDIQFDKTSKWDHQKLRHQLVDWYNSTPKKVQHIKHPAYSLERAVLDELVNVKQQRQDTYLQYGHQLPESMQDNILKSYEDYINYISYDRSWGGNADLMLICYKLNIQINVLVNKSSQHKFDTHPDTTKYGIFAKFIPVSKEPLTEINILFSNSSDHFDSLLLNKSKKIEKLKQPTLVTLSKVGKKYHSPFAQMRSGFENK